MSVILRTKPRQIKVQIGVNPYACASVIIEYGKTKVHVTASLEEETPRWLKNQNRGWVTAEYAMLPAATHTRNKREKNKISGRSQEIQRLIGRSLRAMIDLEKLGERSLIIDCDVLIADGGTRTASITGGAIALELAIKKLMSQGVLAESPLRCRVAAVSVGLDEKHQVIADLNYQEDSTCETDMNIVMTNQGEFVEVQGTAEGRPFSQQALQNLITAAQGSLDEIFKIQEEALS